MPQDDGRIPPDRRSKEGTLARNRVDYRRGYWRQESIRRVQAWDPLATPSSWMSFELQQALEQITGEHARKKKTTLLRLAEATGGGLPMSDVFAQKHTCTPQAWAKWKKDPQISAAYDIAERQCHAYYDRIEMEQGRLRQRQLAATRAEIVDMGFGAIEELRALLHSSNSDRIKLDAIIEILNRGGEETASKSSQDVNLTLARADDVRMSDIGKRTRQRGGVSSDDIVVMPKETDAGPPPPPLPDGDSGMLMIEARGSGDDNGDGQWDDVEIADETVDEPKTER